jgi:Fe-S cluster assembly iron-binding protein IscA
VLGVSPQSVKELKEKLVNGCSKAGIGFRLLVEQNGHGEKTLGIRIDQEREDDEVFQVDGVRLFVDPTNATWIAGHELDYDVENHGGFVFR